MSDVDETLDLEEVSTGDRPLTVPDELPILPLRDTVLYPNMDHIINEDEVERVQRMIAGM